MKKNQIIVILLILTAILVGFFASQKAEKSKQQEIEQIKSQGDLVQLTPLPTITEEQTMPINKEKKYSAILKTTAGEITIELFVDKTPVTANNFVTLSNKNFYDNTIFHRTISGFMIQGGDPKGDGTGGPGYQFDDEPFEGEYTRGIVAMANAGANTNGSQFFIMHADQALPKNYVIFGKVVKGIDVVDKIATAPVEANATGEVSKPVTPVKITSVEIIEK